MPATNNTIYTATTQHASSFADINWCYENLELNKPATSGPSANAKQDMVGFSTSLAFLVRPDSALTTCRSCVP